MKLAEITDMSIVGGDILYCFAKNSLCSGIAIQQQSSLLKIKTQLASVDIDAVYNTYSLIDSASVGPSFYWIPNAGTGKSSAKKPGIYFSLSYLPGHYKLASTSEFDENSLTLNQAGTSQTLFCDGGLMVPVFSGVKAKLSFFYRSETFKLEAQGLTMSSIGVNLSLGVVFGK